MIILQFLFVIWFCGFWAGVGLYLFKYGDYHLHKNYYLDNPDLAELYHHDHKPDMLFRNFLFYCCLSWYGVWAFITKED